MVIVVTPGSSTLLSNDAFEEQGCGCEARWPEVPGFETSCVLF